MRWRVVDVDADNNLYARASEKRWIDISSHHPFDPSRSLPPFSNSSFFETSPVLYLLSVLFWLSSIIIITYS